MTPILRRELLEVVPLIGIFLALRIRAPKVVKVREVPDKLSEGPHFHLRTGTQGVKLFRHLICRPRDVFFVPVVGVAQPSGEWIFRRRLLAGLRRDRKHQQRTEPYAKENVSHRMH